MSFATRAGGLVRAGVVVELATFPSLLQPVYRVVLYAEILNCISFCFCHKKNIALTNTTTFFPTNLNVATIAVMQVQSLLSAYHKHSAYIK